PHHRPTPQQVIDYLTGPHTTPHTLTQNDWLPGPVLDQLSRSAVALLELESEAPALTPPPVPPVPARPPSQGGSPDEASEVALGGAALGDATPARRSETPPPAQWPVAGGGAAPPLTQPPPPSAPHSLPTQTGAAPAPADGPNGPGAGAPSGLSVSVRGERGRRRIGCSVAVTLAAALVGGVLVSPLVFDVFSGTESGDNAGGQPDASKSPSSPSDGGQVPKRFLGTWSGSVRTGKGVPSTFRITIKGGELGRVVARDDSRMSVGDIDCSTNYVLRSVKGNRLVLDSSGNKNPHPGLCADGSDEERFTLQNNGTLRYESGDDAAGNPRGDLTKRD
ncbi:hypothetical protein ABZT14_25550, partial [Streptomyces sp. NPDC005438]